MKILYLLPLGIDDQEVLTSIEVGLWHSFGFPVQRLPAQGGPAYALEPQRGQYSSSLILRSLQKQIPEDAIRLIAITECDLFIPMLSFVFGQAMLKGPVALLSLARLHQAFYGLPEKKSLLLARAVKEAIHETGHTFGLTHCLDNVCPMSLSNTTWQVDRKGGEFCDKCSLRLDGIIRQDPMYNP